MIWTGRVLVLFVVLRFSTLFRGIAQLMKDEDAEEGHSLLLFGAEGLIERFPRDAISPELRYLELCIRTARTRSFSEVC